MNGLKEFFKKIKHEPEIKTGFTCIKYLLFST